ncbi:MAG: hypothetical protein KDC61_19400 [Saprospiraceae bacterium]|nr:hypothetical protein [Saprospiraceae bacterium]
MSEQVMPFLGSGKKKNGYTAFCWFNWFGSGSIDPGTNYCAKTISISRFAQAGVFLPTATGACLLLQAHTTNRP